MKIYDCFTFFTELDLLEIGLNILDSVVDKFVLVEMAYNHMKESKPFYYEENKERYKKFEDKIIHIKVTDLPEPIPSKLCDNGNKWQLENYQRDCIMRGLKDAADDDVVMISDLDEIPNPEMIKNYKDGIQVFHQAMMYYFLNNINIVDSVWKNGTRIGHFSDLKNPNQDLRDECCYEYSKKGMPTYFRFCKGTVVENAGWHFSYCGGIDAIIRKRNSIAEQNFNTKKNMQPEQIKRKIYSGRDILDRKYYYKIVKIDDFFPEYIRNNQDKYNHLILNSTFKYKILNFFVLWEYRLYCISQISKANCKKIEKKIRKTLSPVKRFVLRKGKYE